MRIFVIEDEAHAERHGRFQTRPQAIAELRRRAAIPWDEEPNRAPCIGWRKCGRRYELVEYDQSNLPWKAVSRTLILKVSAAGVKWVTEE
jgi:hypothetical protein